MLVESSSTVFLHGFAHFEHFLADLGKPEFQWRMQADDWRSWLEKDAGRTWGIGNCDNDDGGIHGDTTQTGSNCER